MASQITKNQIENRNFLSKVGFQFTLNRAPKVAFFSNSANIPGLSLGTSIQPTYLKDIDVPGDKMEFEDFKLNFIVDEDLTNYMEIQNWMRGLAYPESLKEIYDLQRQPDNFVNSPGLRMNIYSDGTLTVLKSSMKPNFKVKFSDLWPCELSPLVFDATEADVQYFTSTVTFKYTIYNITNMDGTLL